jgi:hypothetical protein
MIHIDRTLHHPTTDHFNSNQSFHRHRLSTPPTQHFSSSLSPLPTLSPPSIHIQPQLSSSPTPPINVPQEEEEDSQPVQEEEEEEPHPDSNSRQSTPLSELTPAPPDQDGPLESVDASTDLPHHQKTPEKVPEKIPDVVDIVSSIDSIPDIQHPPSSSDPTPSTSRSSSDLPPPTQMTLPSSSSLSSQSPPALHPLSFDPPVTTPQPSSTRQVTASPIPPNDPKVVSILELNAELLKSVFSVFSSSSFLTSY